MIIKTRKSIKNGEVVIIDINTMSNDLSKTIDDVILSICHGKNLTEYSLEYVKRKLYKDLTDNGRVVSDVKRGAIAEFFVHIFLNGSDFRQECFYLNMEEPKGIKKGFDGLYSVDDEAWIMESKSGLTTTINISHDKKIKEAFTDIKVKFSSSQTQNDPWRNAIMHAGHEDIGASKKIKDKLRECSLKFTNKLPICMDEYNFIPASTIYIIDSTYQEQDSELIIKAIEQHLKNFNYNKVFVICITQKSTDILIEYLGNTRRQCGS